MESVNINKSKSDKKNMNKSNQKFLWYYMVNPDVRMKIPEFAGGSDRLLQLISVK